jgi:hypothetical protein
MDKDTNVVHVLKVVKLTGTTGPGRVQVPADDIEVKLMERLQKKIATTGFRHPNIVDLKENWKQHNDKTLCLILEFCGADEGKYQHDIDRICGHLSGALCYCEKNAFFIWTSNLKMCWFEVPLKATSTNWPTLVSVISETTRWQA